MNQLVRAERVCVEFDGVHVLEDVDLAIDNGEFIALDGREMAPAAASRDMFLRNGRGDTELSQTGALASGVPDVLADAPILAGVGKMHYRRFVIYNVAGGLLWTIGVIMLGYWFGNIAFIKNNVIAAMIRRPVR